MDDDIWSEVESVLAETTAKYRGELLGAALRGDREAMGAALASLASLVPHGEPVKVLCAVIRELLKAAVAQGDLGSEEGEVTQDHLESQSREFLDAFAQRLSLLVYRGSGSPGSPSGGIVH